MEQVEQVERQTMTVLEGAIYLGLSKDTLYDQVKQKKIPHFKVGRRILLRRERLDEWMREQEDPN